MVNTDCRNISHFAQNEERNTENVVAAEDSSTSGKGTWPSQKINNSSKFPFYLQLSMFGILVLVLQCFNENTFGNTFECENILQEAALDLGGNRILGESSKEAITPKEVKTGSSSTKSEEASSSSAHVEEVEDEDDDKEMYRKMAEESYKQKVEERYRTMSDDIPARVPGPRQNQNYQGLPKLSEQELIQLLKMLPPPEAMQRRPGIVPGSNADRRLPFNSPEQMLQFLKSMNERQNMMAGNNAPCNCSECIEEDEEDEEGPKFIIKSIIRDISNVAPYVFPAIPPLLMMFIGTQKTYLLLYTLSLIQDAYNFLERIKK
ncbi:hypothetical protein C922_02874 [Plasmodium inui San Antonio 1]|uniref:Uncharacterized protein n=1 Tax=Plasmodium inui San Antonio 1 TaxID=1237626 RepID=W7A6N0_9APIC|nr:hypothetical protein C922_02874 [Plasmodium inui San Antonio 1]EUD66888.1 hypothetical protein C922_02874 [Plasmodium inui San Antonio 1]